MKKRQKPKYPMQPLIVDPFGVVRFKENAIVRFLLDVGPYDMNKLALMTFTKEDRSQFAQLIGYSVSGFCELLYANKEHIAVADEQAAALADPLHCRRPAHE